MSARNDGGSAFPLATAWEADQYGAAANTGYQVTKSEGGMSLRDYFAAKAMQGMWSNAELPLLLPQGTEATTLANMAYEQADAMLKAREA